MNNEKSKHSLADHAHMYFVHNYSLHKSFETERGKDIEPLEVHIKRAGLVY